MSLSKQSVTINLLPGAFILKNMPSSKDTVGPWWFYFEKQIRAHPELLLLLQKLYRAIILKNQVSFLASCKDTFSLYEYKCIIPGISSVHDERLCLIKTHSGLLQSQRNLINLA